MDCEAYSDADCAKDQQKQKSTTGYVLWLGIGPVLWSSCKQHTVSLLSPKGKYMAVLDTRR